VRHSIFSLFRIGVGPSSSHTVGPMRAARMFALTLASEGVIDATARVRCELFGSLGATGRGHGSDVAVILGLLGHEPDSVDVDAIPGLVASARAAAALALPGGRRVVFREPEDLRFIGDETLPGHSNGMRLTALDAGGGVLSQRVYYSIGGGFVVEEARAGAADFADAPAQAPPYPFASAAELLALTRAHGLSIAELMRRNEGAWRGDDDIDAGLALIWRAMQDCVRRGLRAGGLLPGGLCVRRRAAALYESLTARPEAALKDPMQVMDWVNLYALAVNEENAAGGRVVTAPTNGAAGIVPAVLHYFVNFTPRGDDSRVGEFLLTAGAVGLLYKENASISGAEVGCQGEVGVACSMAAAGLCAVLGGAPEQVENAAEIGMEHNLGLTCDPVGGLVQIPCIERNAIAAVKAINAARMALRGDGRHIVSLDQVIRTMRETGADMMSKYKETSRGGLAVNIVEC
jgi:L-serine dehydratase